MNIGYNNLNIADNSREPALFFWFLHSNRCDFYYLLIALLKSFSALGSAKQWSVKK